MTQQVSPYAASFCLHLELTHKCIVFILHRIGHPGAEATGPITEQRGRFIPFREAHDQSGFRIDANQVVMARIPIDPITMVLTGLRNRVLIHMEEFILYTLLFPQEIIFDFLGLGVPLAASRDYTRLSLVAIVSLVYLVYLG